MTENKMMESAVFGGGCFWCTEAIFNMLRGVTSALPGYSGGTKSHPTYEQVSAGTTGHAEVVKIDFDPAQISFRDLLTVFFATHDPTTMNRQGNDVGPQYRSVIFYMNNAQKETAEAYINEINTQMGGTKIVTQVEPFDAFYEAEDYHKNYYARNSGQPYCQMVINPKLKKVKEKFAALLKEQ